MKKELILASTLLFGGGAVEAQSPTPIVEQTPQPEKLDLTSFLGAVRENLNYQAEPKFFKQMEKRAENNPDIFFKTSTLPDGELTLYFPDGFDLMPKVGYRHTVTNGVGNDYNGVPAGLNFFMTDNAVIIDLGKDGTLDGDNAIDLFNFKQLTNKLDTYFVEPELVKDLDWIEKDASAQGPASVYKLFQSDTNIVYFGANQNGFLVNEQVLIEIPTVGTDIIPKP